MAKRKTKKPRCAASLPPKPPVRPAVQAALPIPDPLETSFTAELRKRLGHRAFVSVSLVASPRPSAVIVRNGLPQTPLPMPMVPMGE